MFKVRLENFETAIWTMRSFPFKVLGGLSLSRWAFRRYEAS